MDADAGLDRYVAAQAPVWATVCAELRAARKRTHWIWFVFPQHRALGRSATARHYGLAGRDEAARYVAHPLLGPRLVEAVGLVVRAGAGRTPLQILGSPDDLKLRSCLTLFEAAAPGEACFGAALDALYAGARDPATQALLR